MIEGVNKQINSVHWDWQISILFPQEALDRTHTGSSLYYCFFSNWPCAIINPTKQHSSTAEEAAARPLWPRRQWRAGGYHFPLRQCLDMVLKELFGNCNNIVNCAVNNILYPTLLFLFSRTISMICWLIFILNISSRMASWHQGVSQI